MLRTSTRAQSTGTNRQSSATNSADGTSTGRFAGFRSQIKKQLARLPARTPAPKSDAVVARLPESESAEQKTEREKIEKQMLKDRRSHFGMANASRDKFSQRAIPTNSTHLQKLAEAHPAAINDPINGMLQQKATVDFIVGMKQEIERVCHAAGNDPAIPENIRNKLRTHSAALTTLLLKTRANCDDETENGHKILRDCFAQSGVIARKMAALAAAGKPVASRPARSNPLPKLERFFSDFSQLSLELKRFHYTNATVFRLDDYARATVDKIAKFAPGVMSGRTGSDVVRSFEVGFGFKMIKLRHVLNAGPFGSFKWASDDRHYIDEDGEQVRTPGWKFTARAGAAFKANKLTLKKEHNKGHHVVNFSGSGYLSRTRGSYHDHLDPLSSTKASLVREGNDWQWRVFCRSGDPHALSNRIYAKVGHAGRFVGKYVFGVPHMPIVGRPNLNWQKLEKGAFNGDKVMELASRFGDNLPPLYQQGQGDGGMRALVTSAYPTVVTIDIPPDLACSKEKGVVAPGVYNPLPLLSPTPSPFNRYPESLRHKSLTRWTGGLTINGTYASLDWTKPQPGQMRAGGGGSVNLEGSRNYTYFSRLKPAFEFLDPAYNKDIQVSHRILRQLELRYGGKPKLHSYQATSRQLDEHVHAWRGDVHSQTRLKLENADRALTDIKAKYLRFRQAACTMKALEDPAYCKSLPDHGRKAEADFQAVVKEVFGIDKLAMADQTRFVAELRRDPRKFMREGHDALSLALGKVGVHLYETKEQLHDPKRCDRNHPDTDKLWEGAQQADAQFAAVRGLLTAAFLPIGLEDLLRGTAIYSTAESFNKTLALSAEGSGGMWSSLSQYFKSNGADPTSPSWNDKDKTNSSKPGWLSTGSGFAAGVAFNIGRRFAPKHPNPLRCGDYRLMKASMKGNGVAAYLLDVGAKRYLDDIRSKIDDGDKSQSEKFKKSMLETARALERTVAADYSSEFGIDIGNRTPKPVGKYEYETTNQFTRVSSKTTTTYGISAGGPVGPGVLNLSGSVAGTRSASNVLYETMGACPAYHMLQFVMMKKMLNACQAAKPLAKDKATGHTGRGVDFADLDSTPLSEQVDFRKLRNLLIPEKLTDYVPGTAIDRNYMLVKYFGTEETIMGFMDIFMRYSESRREVGKPPATVDGKRTEFHRFEDDEGYFKVIQQMRKSEKFAPGSLTNTKTDYAPSKEDFLENAAGDARPTLDTADIKAAMAAVRKRFAGRSDVTAEERAACFLGEAGTPGRKVFEAYIKVVSGYCDICNGFKADNSYEIFV